MVAGRGQCHLFYHFSGLPLYKRAGAKNARKSKAVHQIIFHTSPQLKTKISWFQLQLFKHTPHDAPSNIYVLSNISMQPSFISTPDKLHGLHNVFLQLGSVYFSTEAECISPPQRSVAETSQQQIWSVSKSLTDPIKVDRDATNYDKERGRLWNPSNEISCFQLWKAQLAMGLLCPFPTRILRPYKSSFSGHCLALAMTLKLNW